jgi:hypothetical protein
MASTTPITNTSFFRPTGIPGCALWLDAADSATVIRTGSAVTRWNDKSGSNINMIYDVGTLTYNTTGFNGSPTITFGPGRSGLTYNSNLNLTYTNSLSFYLVLRPTTSSANIRILSFFAGGVDYTPPGFNISLYNPSSTDHKIGFGRGTPYAGFNPLNVYNTNIFTSIIFNGNLSINPAVPLSNTGIGINGNTFANFTGYSIGSNFSTYNPFRIGEWSGATGDIFNGNISEIIMFNRALNATENQQVEGYLGWKWGLQRSLPVNHPYYNNPQQSTYPYTLLRTIPQPQTSLPSWSFFSPRSIPSCSLWLDAADATSLFKDTAGTLPVTTNGDIVRRINDKSGNSRNATTASTSGLYTLAQLNGNSSIRAPVASYLGFATPSFIISAEDRVTCFIVVQQNSTLAGNVAFIDANTTTLLIQRESAFIRTIASQVAITTANAGMLTNIGNPNIYEITFDGGSGTIISYLNGSSQASNTLGSGGDLRNSTVVSIAASSTFYGNLYEVILYSRVLSTGERQQVEGYLALKWGLQRTLPTAHPTKANFLYPILPLLPAVTQSVAPSPINPNSRFVPTSLSGLALWLDAADVNSITQSNGLVSQWNDKSANGSNATQVTVGNRPTYINNGVRFTASSSNSMSINVPYSISHSVFLVARSTTGTQNYYYGRSNGGAAPTIIQHYVGTSIEYFDGTDRATFVTSPPTNSPFIVNFVRSYGNTVTGFYMGNRAFSIPQTWVFDQINSWIYIGRSDFNTNYLNATICEFMIFRAALTTTQRQQVEGYLAWKWGLRSSLPSTHPNAFMPP